MLQVFNNVVVKKKNIQKKKSWPLSLNL